jgi:heme oxygenase
MRALVQGNLPSLTYAILLRNLLDIYAALEARLFEHREAPGIAPIFHPALARSAALCSDLERLRGPEWRALPVCEAARAYTARIDEVDPAHPEPLVAHAYVRYLGDLNGGQVLVRVVRRTILGDAPDGARFFDFGTRDEIARLVEHLRAGLDAVGLARPAAVEAIIGEARSAFLLHEALFQQVEGLAAAS